MHTLTEKSLQKLELGAVLQLLAEQACSEEAKARCLELLPVTDVDDIRQLQEQTSAACKLMVQKGSPGLVASAGSISIIFSPRAPIQRCLPEGEGATAMTLILLSAIGSTKPLL